MSNAGADPVNGAFASGSRVSGWDGSEFAVYYGGGAGTGPGGSSQQAVLCPETGGVYVPGNLRTRNHGGGAYEKPIGEVNTLPVRFRSA